MKRYDELEALRDNARVSVQFQKYNKKDVLMRKERNLSEGKESENDCLKSIEKSQEISTKPMKLSTEERIEIGNKLKNISMIGMTITNWAVRGLKLDIYYMVETSQTIRPSEDDAIKKLNDYLQPALKERVIKMIELKNKPQYKPTSGPGSKIGRMTDIEGIIARMGSIGIFVNVNGKGIHVLQSGHDKTLGEELRLEKTPETSIGEVKLIILGISEDQTFRDIALTKLPFVSNCVRPWNIIWQPAPCVLSRIIQEPVENAVIMKFSEPIGGFVKGNIYQTSFSFVGGDYGDVQNCITVILPENPNQNNGFHFDGESGTLATTIPNQSTPNEVGAVMMLVGKVTMEEELNGPIEMSVGVSMETILKELMQDQYCNAGVEIL